MTAKIEGAFPLIPRPTPSRLRPPWGTGPELESGVGLRGDFRLQFGCGIWAGGRNRDPSNSLFRRRLTNAPFHRLVSDEQNYKLISPKTPDRYFPSRRNWVQALPPGSTKSTEFTHSHLTAPSCPSFDNDETQLNLNCPTNSTHAVPTRPHQDRKISTDLHPMSPPKSVAVLSPDQRPTIKKGPPGGRGLGLGFAVNKS